MQILLFQTQQQMKHAEFGTIPWENHIHIEVKEVIFPDIKLNVTFFQNSYNLKWKTNDTI